MTFYNILPEMVLRTPVWSFRQYQSGTIQQHLNDPFFRAAICLASHSFYQELLTNDFSWDKLPRKARCTVRKYLNRMCYRTTPFGAFSAFNPVRADQKKNCLIVHNSPFKLHMQPDFSEVVSFYKSYTQSSILELPLYANDCIYITNHDIRYLYVGDTETGDSNFEIRKAEKQTGIVELLRYCAEPRKPDILISYMTEFFAIAIEEAKGLLCELIDNQLLKPTINAILTGANAFTGIRGFQNSPLENKQIIDREQFERLPFYSNTSDVQGKVRPAYYANLQLEITGSLAETVRNDLDQALYALRKLSLCGDPPALVEFREAFVKRFDQRLVPLLEAIDAEIGISYGGLVQVDIGLLLKDLNFEVPDPAIMPLQWGPIQQLLLKNWPATGKALDLTTHMLESLPDQGGNCPPSFSLLFRICGEQLQIDQVGGSSATAITGRFTPFDKKLYIQNARIARLEAEANPGIVFAEVVHACGGHVDNINLREQIRNYEIPVLTESSLPEENQLRPSDLYLCHRNGELQLWSKRLNKRIIPRLSSAYNHQRNPLALFRILTDLQYQGLKHSWNLDMSRLFPGLPFYPRISYLNCVLSPATWTVIKNDTSINYDASPHVQRQQFLKFAARVGLPFKFALTSADRFLVISQDNPDDLDLFLLESKSGHDLIIKELFLENEQGGTITNTGGETHANQFIAAIINKHCIYPESGSPDWKIPKVRRKSIIGGQWLYYKIYLSIYNSNEVVYRIHTILKKLQIRNWFFIRYHDPEAHLRVRINVDSQTLASCISSLYPDFENMVKSGKIIRIENGTYERELERYSAIGIVAAEEIFCRSTSVILATLSFNKRSAKPEHEHGLTFTWKIICQSLPVLENRVDFLREVQQKLFFNYGGSAVLKRTLDQKKRWMKSEVNLLLSNQKKNLSTIQKEEEFLLRNLKLLAALRPGSVDAQLLADLIHMHLNRLFYFEMRRQELVIYTLLLQYALMLLKQKS